MMQFVPSFLSQLIDAVAFQEEPEEYAQNWQEWKADFERYYERESDHTLSELDASVVRNLPSQYERLTRSVESALQGSGNADDLVRDCNEFFASYDSFQYERDKKYFVESPPLDRLLKATVAHLQGRAEFAAVKLRIPEAIEAVSEVGRLLTSARADLPEALVSGTEQGLSRAEHGFSILTGSEHLSQESLEDAIFELKSAGELLEHLPRLVRRFEEEAGSPVPIVGPLLGLLRQEDNEEALEEFQKRAWPSFLDLWHGRRDAWMLDPEVADELLQAAGHEVSIITETASSYHDEEDSFWDAVERLEDLFDRMRENTLRLDGLSSSPYWPEAALLISLLRDGASLYVAGSAASGIALAGAQAPPAVRETGKALSSFLDEPDPLILLRALKALQTDFEQSKSSRLCPGCGERISLEAPNCPHCGQEVGEFSISG